MEYRPLEITVVSAKDLNDVNLFSKMDVYSYVSISGDPRTKQRTPVEKDCGSNPNWNFTMKFNIDEAAASQNRLNLVFQIRAERSLGDRDIGEVNVPIKELLDKLGDGKSAQFVTYQVRKPSGKPKGELNFSYKFGDKIDKPMPPMAPASHKGGDEPVTAYPAGTSSSSYPPPGAGYPPPGAAGGYPPPGAPAGYPHQGGYPPAGYPHQGGYPPAGYPPAGYGPPPPPMTGYGGYQQPPPPSQGGYGGYQQPPPPGYGYPPQGGYGYPPQQQQVKPPKKSKFGGAGLGLGAGLLGGALGGLLIGDMISDAGSGYDGGFDDGGGFDF